jgi:adenine phosphoribosyltransferase
MAENKIIDDAIRKIPNFPKPGVLFYDITGILIDPNAFQYCIDKMVEIYSEKKIGALAAIEARGFLFASPLALKMQLPLVLVRKKGKLPGATVSKTFTLEYGKDEVEVHKEDLDLVNDVLIVDDLIATGGTIKATYDLFSENNTNVAGVFGVVGLPFLNYSQVLETTEITTLIEYHGESIL